MDHVILTRFNLPSAGAESVIRARHGWLTERIELFESYCLPSVRAQTNPGFTWIIYFDPESPEWLRDRVSAHAAAGHYVPIYRTQVSRTELVGDISAQFDVKSNELLTTNLDNDDGLASDFIERLHAAPRPGGSTAYYLTNGLIKNSGGVYLNHDRHNAFASMRESWEAPITCWADWHNRLSRHVPVIEIGGAPGWLQVLHGSNVSNRTKGRLVSPTTYRNLFAPYLDDIKEPDSISRVRDYFVSRPGRIVRDTGRTVLKTVALKLFGAGGFERAKRRLASRRRVKLPT
jgi:hypothetical protein